MIAQNPSRGLVRRSIEYLMSSRRTKVPMEVMSYQEKIIEILGNEKKYYMWAEITIGAHSESGWEFGRK